MRELPKLPQARMYLRAARWGLDQLLAQKLSGSGFIFHVIGVLSALRAVQHALMNHDKTLSPEHGRVISAWLTRTKNTAAIPELHFIKRSRDLILKGGSFESYATRHESSSEPGFVGYEIAYYPDGQRRDLEIDVRASLDWLERELSNIESALPARHEEDSSDNGDTFDYLKATEWDGIASQIIAGTVPGPIEDGAVITFSRRPEPWRSGDIIEVFQTPSGRMTFVANEQEGFRFTWKPNDPGAHWIELEQIDDCHHRMILRPVISELPRGREV